MGLFNINYDLIATKNYDRIINELTRLGAIREQFSTWGLEIDLTDYELLNHLQNFMDWDDKLMVSTLSKQPARNAAMIYGTGNLRSGFINAFERALRK